MTTLDGLHLPHALCMRKRHGGRRSCGEARPALPLPRHAPPSGLCFPPTPLAPFQAEHSARDPQTAWPAAPKLFSLPEHLDAKAFCPHQLGLPNVTSVQDLTLAGG